jgi:hypothetical protein
MKPKYRRIVRSMLPTLIVVPAMTQMALAGTIAPDTPGNILVPSNYNGGAPAADTIDASGGTTSPFTADIRSGAILTGDAVLLHGLIVSSGDYTVLNAGTLNATAGRGISAGVAFTLTNSGLIQGNGTHTGVYADGGSTLHNSGTIVGDDDGIRFFSAGGIVNNSGSITATGSSFGISGLGSITVTNSLAGTISGDSGGINGLTALTITNAGQITASNGIGITATDTLSVVNTGNIAGTGGAGISAGNAAQISNNSIFDIFGNVIGGGSINSSTQGIVAGNNANIINQLQATITGNADGVVVGDDATLLNRSLISGGTGNAITAGNTLDLDNRGTLSGGTTGINAGNDAGISNSGSVTGGSGDGILAGTGLGLSNSGSVTTTGGSGVAGGAGATITNSNLIRGNVGVTAAGGGATISNSGQIIGAGGVAISLGDNAGVGSNTVTLTNGVLDGNIVATGSGNLLQSSAGNVYGAISGIQSIAVDPSGYLEIYGNITGPTTINVAASGELGGEGTWQADINLASGASIFALDEGNSDLDSGVLAISGTVTHAVNSAIITGINPDSVVWNDGSNATLIRSSSGTYNATNAIIDLDTSSDSALRNGSYVIVQAGGGTVLGGGNTIHYFGNSDSVLGNFFAEASLRSGDLVVDINHQFGALPGLGANERSLGNALDAFMDDESDLPSNTSNSWALRELIGDLDYNDLNYTQYVLGSIVSPIESALALTESTINSNYRLHRQVENHLAVARSGGDVVRTYMNSSNGSKGGVVAPPTTSYDSKGNVWGTFSYDWQDYDGPGSAADFDGEVGAFTAGFDYQVAPNFILGILLDGSKADLDGLGDSLDVDSFRVAIYGTWGASTGLYSDFLLGYGDHDLDFADADSFQALGTIGYAFGDERVKHGPFAGLEYQEVDVDGFGYTSFVPVRVSSYDVDSFRGLLGYRVNSDLGTFRPYASIAYAHEFEDNDTSARATVAGTPFRVSGADQGSALLISTGTGIKLNESLTLDLGYRGEIALDDEGIDSHGGSLGLNYRF